MIDRKMYLRLEREVRRDFALAAIDAGHDARTACMAATCYVRWSHLRVDHRRDRPV